MAKAAVETKPEKLVDPRRKAVRVQVGPLLAGLKDVATLIDRGTVPILANVLFDSDGAAGGFGIRLTGTNLDIVATRFVNAEFGDAETREFAGFTTTLPAKPLLAVLSELDSEATILIEMTPEKGAACRATLTCGRLVFKLPTLPVADFPLTPGFEVAIQFEIAPSVLADALAAVHHAISTEETRYYLNGVYMHPFQAQGEALFLRLATTDGHRLARLTMDAPDGSASFASVIIPKATVALVEKLLNAVCKGRSDTDAPELVLIESDGRDKGRLRFVVGDTEIISKTIDGDFPDYTRVIPTASLHTALVDRAALTGAIRRVAALASKDSRAIKAVFSTGQIELSMHSPENGEASEQLPCSFDGDEIRIGFNSKFWLDALGALASDEVEMGLSDPSAPVTLRPAIDGERFVQVLMPMAI